MLEPYVGLMLGEPLVWGLGYDFHGLTIPRRWATIKYFSLRALLFFSFGGGHTLVCWDSVLRVALESVYDLLVLAAKLPLHFSFVTTFFHPPN